MKTKSVALFAALVVVASLLISVAMAPGAAAQGEPLITLIPLKTNLIVYLPITIPDPALNQALHTATGVPIADNLFANDLAGLDGLLNLSGKGIADATGLQYCTNLSELKLDDNKLATLPDSMKKLTKLKKISLVRNKLTEFPSVLLQMPGLVEIRLTSNGITALPDTIDAITNLKIFYIDKNKLAALPASLADLAKLQIIYCNSNEIKKLPKELFKAPALETLYADQNRLTEIPAEVKTAPKLTALSVSYNQISKLPAGLGNAPKLTYFLAGYNALTAVEESIYTGNPKYVFLDGNRIKTLPDAMKNRTFEVLRVEWNYMDVTPGSKNRSILDSLTINNDMSFLNQLTPVSITSNSSTQDSISLKWKALAGGSAGTTSWEVDKFVLYDATNNPAANLETLDESVNECTVDGLASGREYNLFVRVYYKLTVSGMGCGSSCDTYVKVTTLPAVASSSAAAAVETATNPPATEQTAEQTTAQASPDSSASAAAEPSPTPLASESSVPASAAGGDSGVVVAIIAVGGALVLAIVALIVVLLMRKKPKTIRVRR